LSFRSLRVTAFSGPQHMSLAPLLLFQPEHPVVDVRGGYKHRFSSFKTVLTSKKEIAACTCHTQFPETYFVHLAWPLPSSYQFRNLFKSDFSWQGVRRIALFYNCMILMRPSGPAALFSQIVQTPPMAPLRYPINQLLNRNGRQLTISEYTPGFPSN
jgi:hypothetical protein